MLLIVIIIYDNHSKWKAYATKTGERKLEGSKISSTRGKIPTCGLFYDGEVTICGAFVANFFHSKGYNFDQIIKTVTKDEGNSYEDLQRNKNQSCLRQTTKSS